LANAKYALSLPAENPHLVIRLSVNGLKSVPGKQQTPQGPWTWDLCSSQAH